MISVHALRFASRLTFGWLAAMIVTIDASESRAQAPARAPQAPAAATAPPPAPVDPIALDLVATNPTEPTNILRVVGTLIELKQGELGKPLVQKLLAMNLDDEQLAVLYDQYGSTLLMRMKLTPGLEPEAGQLFDAMTAAVERRNSDPARITQAIEKLQSESAAERGAALSVLRGAHERGAVALWNLLADEARAAEHAAAQRALVALEGDAVGPTLAVFDRGDAKLRPQAIEVLGRLADPRAELALYRAAFAAKSPVDEASAARRLLAERMTEPAAAAAKLAIAAERLLVPEPPLAQELVAPTKMWVWDATKREPVAIEVAESVARLDWAVRWAVDAGAIVGEQNVDVRRLFFTALVERSLARAEAGIPAEQAAAGVREAFASLSIEQLEDLLKYGSEKHPTVAVVATQTLGTRGLDVIQRHAPSVSPLVAATQHPDRRLRFAAVGAVMQLAPSKAYPGSSQVVEALRFMLQTRGRPAVLVADARMEVARNVGGMLRVTGYEADAADTARDTVKLAISSPDYEFIVLDMNLASPTSGELIKRLRRDARTGSLPIAVVVGGHEFERAKRLVLDDPMVEAFLRPYDPETARQMAVTLMQRAARRSTNAGERVAQAQQALAWVKQLAAAKQTPYDLSSLEEPVIDTAQHPALTAGSIAILATFPTHASQQALAGVANLEMLPLEVRQAASAALVENIGRHGTRLTTDEIVRQYDRYNASEHEPAEVQKLLSAILDAIEQRAAQATPS